MRTGSARCNCEPAPSLGFATLPSVKRIALSNLFLALVVLASAAYLMRRPSNNRDWALDQAILPSATINGSSITIRNIRNFTYRSVDDYTPGYYDKTYSLNDVESLWLVVSPFAGSQALAHTFLSFGFKGGQYLSLSVEIRKEKGEEFGPLLGLLRTFEIMYVLADERDVIGLRTNHRKDDVYLYPVTAQPNDIKNLFLDVLKNVNRLTTKPEFYNTLLNTCNTSIVRHINNVVPGAISLSRAVFLPGYFDRKVHTMGAIGQGMSYEGMRKRHLINELAQAAGAGEDFSARIRAFPAK
jgi:hypothetical protein